MMNKKELFWLIFSGCLWTTCYLVMLVLTILKLTSTGYWYENLISAIATSCLVYGLIKLGQLFERRKHVTNIEKLIDEESEK